MVKQEPMTASQVAYLSTCEGKAKFESAALAHEVLTRKQRKARHGRRMKTYRCKVCGSWHIGEALR